MELRHLRYFVKAAELLHFTKAAETLYVSQPSLSAQIHQLEEELGTELFARIGRNVRLTEAGKLLLPHARQAIKEVEQASEEISATTGLLKGNLAIGALPAHGSKLLPSWITSFCAKYPNVHIKARSGTTEDIEHGLLNGIFDLGFTTLPIEHDEIHIQELFVDHIVLAVAQNHPLAQRQSLSIEELQTIPLALASHRVMWIRELDKYWAGLGFQPKIVVEYDDGNALTEIVKKGEVGTLLPSMAVHDDTQLSILSLPNHDWQVTMAAIWCHLTPAGKAFLDIAAQDMDNKKIVNLKKVTAKTSSKS
jgi:LysR family cyn operon transcriptional activator